MTQLLLEAVLPALAATLCMARILTNVLCIDAGKPCNRYASHSHNFLTNDGKSPAEIRLAAQQQIAKYETAKMVTGMVQKVSRDETSKLFNVSYSSQDKTIDVTSKKIFFASGVSDLIEETRIPDYEKFWGSSIIHCPFCHGYEFANARTGLLFNSADMINGMAAMISNLSKNLVVLTNSQDVLTAELSTKLKSKGIEVFDKPITKLVGNAGKLEAVEFSDGSTTELSAIYNHPAVEMNNKSIIESLGVELTETGLVKVDNFQNTNVDGVYAARDATTQMRSITIAAYQGHLAGVMMVKTTTTQAWLQN